MSVLDQAWEFLWAVMLWVFFLLAVLGFIILIFAVMVGIIRGVAQVWRGPFKRVNRGQHVKDRDPMI